MTAVDPTPPVAPSPTGPAICAVGASAGGLEALEAFFDHTPVRAGVAYVVLQHLSPDHKSLMPELLARHTSMRVERLVDGMRIEPDTLYLNSPKSDVTVEGNQLRVRATSPTARLHLPIDTFFESLAHSHGERAVGVVLSGTGSDGTRGARELKAAGGAVFVQDPAEAQFDGMPRSVVSTGLADRVLPVADIPAAVAQFFARDVSAAPLVVTAEQDAATPPQLHRILDLLRDRVGTDFTGYKPATILRRIDRRVQMHSAPGWDDYVRLLEHSPRELGDLHRDLLINVTKFFRDDDAYRLVEERVIPELLASMPRGEELRVWVPACSTGEEPYSIVMLLLEALERRGDRRELRVFATDVDADAVDFAGAGRYPESIAADVSPERLARFFVRDGDGYRVTRALRDRVVFARHNLLRDPPLTRMDWVSCRNMLIYVGPEMQRRVVALLAYALRARGVLWLGASETVGALSSLFELVDPKWKVYLALHAGRQTLTHSLPGRPRRVAASAAAVHEPTVGHVTDPAALARGSESLLEQVYQELAQMLALRAFVIDGDGHLVHTFGDVRALLQLPSGRPTLDVFQMLPKPLALAIRSAVQRASRDRQPVVFGDVTVQAGDPPLTVHVRPAAGSTSDRPIYLVMLHSGPPPTLSIHSESFDAASAQDTRSTQLEHELQSARENLQATIEELETSNEELQATNEELLASNEELQSTNEELQSVNEELQTVNAEFQEKIVELVALNDDMKNLMRTTGTGTVFLDDQLRIRKFTDAATRLLNVMPRDIGRPLAHIASTLPWLDLVTLSQRVLESGVGESHELELGDDMHLHLRVLPYASSDAMVRGVVLNIADVTEVKSGEKRLQAILDALPACVAVLDQSGVIVQTNTGWQRFVSANSAPPPVAVGIGLNYLAACRAAVADASAELVANELAALLAGQRTSFELEYPCHAPTESRVFLLQAMVLGGRFPGAIVQLVNVTGAVQERLSLRDWVAQIQALEIPGLAEMLPPWPASP